MDATPVVYLIMLMYGVWFGMMIYDAIESHEFWRKQDEWWRNYEHERRERWGETDV